jgi:GGDEF domain-containing protein
LERLIANADLALYHSKQAGRNRVSCYAQLAGEGS